MKFYCTEFEHCFKQFSNYIEISKKNIIYNHITLY